MPRRPPPPAVDVDPIGKLAQLGEDFCQTPGCAAVIVVIVPDDGPVIQRWNVETEVGGLRAIAGVGSAMGDMASYLTHGAGVPQHIH